MNSPYIAVYGLKDLFDYIRFKKWKEWQGFGLLIFCGLFGSGKSFSAANYVVNSARKYNLNVYSNIKLYGVEYIPLVNYQQIIKAPKNSIFLLDEISTLFNSRSWKNFNMTLLFQLLQCRKQRKQLVCTAQRFEHVDKLLRDITYEVIFCTKHWRFFHCRAFDAWEIENTQNSSLVTRKYHWWTFATNDMYNCYDTDEIIDNVKKIEFIDNSEILDKQGISERSLNAIEKPNRKLKKIKKSK